MAKPAAGDPFDAGEYAPLSVPAGAFSADGPAHPERTGATSARWLKGGAWNRFRSHSSRSRQGLITAITLVLLMAVVVPAGISMFAAARRDALAAEASATGMPTIVVLSPESQAVQSNLEPIQAAYLMSNGIADPAIKAEMGKLIDDTHAAVLADDAGDAQRKLDGALAYFITTYSQSLPARADQILLDYPYSEWETDERIAELKAIIVANSQGQDLSALVDAVIELPQRIGDAMSEHLGNRVTYVPPRPSTPAHTPAPPPSAPPSETPPADTPPADTPPTEVPPPSSGEPGPTGTTGNGGGNNGNGGGNGGSNNGSLPTFGNETG